MERALDAKVISPLVSGSVTGPSFASCWVLSKRGFGSVVALVTWVSAHPSKQTPPAAGWRRAEELPLDGGQGFDWRGRCPLTSPGPGSGFQTRPGPQVLKCMCVYACPHVSGLRWGTWSRSTRCPFHLLPPVPCCCWLRGGPSAWPSSVFSFPNSGSLLPPPCPLLGSLIASLTLPHSLAHPSGLSAATLPCPPLLSSLLGCCPLSSGLLGFSVSCSVRSGLSRWLHPLSPTPPQ